MYYGHDVMINKEKKRVKIIKLLIIMIVANASVIIPNRHPF